MQKTVLLASAVLAVLTSPALAQQQQSSQQLLGCTCSSQTKPGERVTGTVTEVSGTVLFSGRQLSSDAVLNAGSVLTTGADGTARLQIGTCDINVQPSSNVTVSRTGPDICVWVAQNGVAPQTGGVASSVPVGTEALLTFGFAAGAGGTVWYLNETADSASN